MDFPGNSDRVKREEKKVEQVTSEAATRRKKSIGKQFKETFVGGSAKDTAQYVFLGVLMPAIQDMLVEAGSQGFERLIRGETRRRSGPPSGATGHFNYQQRSVQHALPSQQRPPLTKRARALHDFDEIVLPSQSEAAEVLERLGDLVDQYSSASVADLYVLVGIQSSHTDQKWGWTDLRSAEVGRIRGGGYLLDLPAPQPLD